MGFLVRFPENCRLVAGKVKGFKRLLIMLEFLFSSWLETSTRCFGRSSFSFIMFLKFPSFYPPTAREQPWEDSQAVVAESQAHSPLGPIVPESCQHLSLLPEHLGAHSFLAHQSNLQMTGTYYYCKDWDTRGGQAVTKFQGVASGPPWEGHMETDPHSLYAQG